MLSFTILCGKPTCHLNVTQAGLKKCLNCANLRGKDAGVFRLARQGDMECGCSMRLAALHLFLVKLTCDDLAVPTRPVKPKDCENTSWRFSDYGMYDPVLKMVESAIFKLTGMPLEQLFTNELARVSHTAEYSLAKLANLIDELQDDDGAKEVRKLGDKLAVFLKERAEAARETEKEKRAEKRKGAPA
jgi:hypothetical protein